MKGARIECLDSTGYADWVWTIATGRICMRKPDGIGEPTEHVFAYWDEQRPGVWEAISRIQRDAVAVQMGRSPGRRT